MKRLEAKPAKFKPTDSPMEVLVKLSRHYGTDPDFVIAGGGNTSMKTEEVLYVKASGLALGTIDASGFVALRRKDLADLLMEKQARETAVREERVKQGLLAARVERGTTLRPSVEAILHHIVAGRYVVHTHSTYANALACCADGERLAHEWFSDKVLWVGYADPGFLLARAVAEALADYRRRTGRDAPEAILLQNHGLIVSGDAPEVILKRTEAIVGRIRKETGKRSDKNVFGKVKGIEAGRARRLIEVMGPALRALLAEGANLKVVTFDDSEFAVSLAGGAQGRVTAMAGPLAPDQIVCAGAFPMWFEAPGGGEGAVFSPQRTQRAQRETTETRVQKKLQEEADGIIGRLRKSIATHARSTGFAPKVIIVKGLGIFSAGDDYQAAEIVRQTYLGAVRVMGLAKRLGGIHPMTAEQSRFIEGWEAETYRKRAMAGTEAKGRAAGKVAVVTGAAQGFGLEISQDLAAEGAHVALADVNVAGVERAAREISERVGAGRAMGVAMDVTKSASIAEAIHQIVRTFGGFDLVVSNAGVLRAGSVMTQPEAEFDLVTDVNYKGYFRCVQGCAPILATQHKARPSYRSDIIQVNSKSGLVGSNRNGAYAGGKFGGIGLTQSFALELMEHGIKVNAVCPGNFFDGPLWSDPKNGLFVQYLRSGKIPGAKTVKDVRRAYEAMIPMGRGCTTADVMKAIYYLMEQQYETGQAVPVTGGQVMLR